MAETYEHHAAGLESPALHAFDVLPDDVIPLPSPTRAVGNAGHLCLTLLSGPTVTFQNLQEGHARIVDAHHRHGNRRTQLSAVCRQPPPSGNTTLSGNSMLYDTFVTGVQVDVSKDAHRPLIGPCGSLDRGACALWSLPSANRKSGGSDSGSFDLESDGNNNISSGNRQRGAQPADGG
ncbi:spike base protein, RCAP_Rcc01079 family [Agrobacterium fabrum]|uniref:spike base protein, RCAP_Rcc01079 family n=1 Tax=Agrobacterium fabrum TaxID=1176649 RepID=UPI001FCF0B6E|nr:hypothetical protein [Agrobacterium fabrum]WCK79589.1 hypothetical protein G6L39_018450 [Agrobacterium fabrum]